MPTIEIAAKEFMLACRADGLAPTTLRWYRHMIRPFAAEFYNKQLDQLTASQMRDYVARLRERPDRYVRAAQRPQIAGGLSHESLRDHLRALRRFFNWAWAEYNLEANKNPMLKLRMPGRERKEPKAISLEDLGALLAACDDSQAGKRDRAMITLLADTGCRLGGLLTLKKQNLYLNDGYAVVTEKGNRDRAVPFIRSTAEVVAAWLEVRPYEAGDYVFCALGAGHFGNPLTSSGLHMVLRRLKKSAGVSGRVNPHSFRHGFARQYLANGGDLATLAQLMGHSDVSVTVGFYAVFKDRELAKVHEKFSPMRKMGGRR